MKAPAPPVMDSTFKRGLGPHGPSRVQGRRPWSWLLILFSLTACGDYPQPLMGHPGRVGARLAVPPPPRLVVPPPSAALLTSEDATRLAADLAQALDDKEVPAVARAATAADWRLSVTAELQETGPRGPMVIVTYTVRNPRGIAQGSSTAPPVSAQTWSMATPVALQLVAARDAPAIATLLGRIEAAVQLSDPNSLVNRPPRIDLTGVTGAPGDGDIALEKNMSAQLAGLGLVVQNTSQGADFSLAATVTMTPVIPNQTRVEIAWIVHDIYSREVGHLVQMNDIPQGSLDHYWGDVAEAIAQEAAGGVREVIINQTASRHIGTQPGHGAPSAALPLVPASGSR